MMEQWNRDDGGTLDHLIVQRWKRDGGTVERLMVEQWNRYGGTQEHLMVEHLIVEQCFI